MRDRGEHRSALLKRRNARHIQYYAVGVPIRSSGGKPRLTMVNEFSQPIRTVSNFDTLAALPKLAVTG